jgi:hypothetical protein
MQYIPGIGANHVGFWGNSRPQVPKAQGGKKKKKKS